VTMTIRTMVDADGSVREGIEALRVSGVVDESPWGRVRAVDAMTHAVYTDLYEILTGEGGVSDPGEFESTVNDLVGQLVVLQTRTAAAWEAANTTRWGPQSPSEPPTGPTPDPSPRKRVWGSQRALQGRETPSQGDGHPRRRSRA
jgi:hypothetical protein